jgi:glycosyltransferase involved in cell wall biosynthesis
VDWKIECAAVIPCLDEAATIRALVEAVRPHLPIVVVVDDGSNDGTGVAANAAGAKVFRIERPSGKGSALRTGFAHARANGFTWALTLDGDGQHSPADIPAFFRRADESSANLVVGNRMEAPSDMPWLRRWVNRWMSRRLSKLAGCPLPDSQCGFRLVNLQTLARLPLSSAHFEIESEMLVEFVRAGERVEFVPIQVIYRQERSKIHPVRDTIRWFRWWKQVQRIKG